MVSSEQHTQGHATDCSDQILMWLFNLCSATINHMALDFQVKIVKSWKKDCGSNGEREMKGGWGDERRVVEGWGRKDGGGGGGR